MAAGKASRGLSIRGYAQHRKDEGLPGGNPSAVQRAIKAGRITRNRHGKIDPERADAEWSKHTNPALSHGKPESGGNGDSADGTYQEHRARIAAIDAEIKQLDLDERRKRVAPVELVGRLQFQFARALRDRMLQVGAHVAPEIVGSKSIRKIERAIEREVRAGLEEVANLESSD